MNWTSKVQINTFSPNPSRDEVNFDPDEIDILHITNILGETVKPELKDNTVTFYRPGSYFISFLRKDIIENFLCNNSMTAKGEFLFILFYLFMRINSWLCNHWDTS